MFVIVSKSTRLSKSAVSLPKMVGKSIFFNFLKIYVVIFQIKKKSLQTVQNSIFGDRTKPGRIWTHFGPPNPPSHTLLLDTYLANFRPAAKNRVLDRY